MPLPVGLRSATDLCRSRAQLLAENLLLRQQLIVLQRQGKRPKLRRWDRLLMLVGARFAAHWRETTLIVKPDTILRWHREGFRLLWRFKSRPRKPGRPPVKKDLVELIQHLATENALWGAERIRGELLKLNIRVAKCDFLQLYDIWFRPIFAFFIIDINTKEVIHLDVTRGPSESWTAQQLRNATPFGKGPEFIIRDRDSKFGGEFDRVAKGVETQVVRTAVKAPLMNSVCERFLGSVRREALDHVIILNEDHLGTVLSEYCSRYHNRARPHQGLGQRVPLPQTRKPCVDLSRVIGLPVLGGLHHDYQVAA